MYRVLIVDDEPMALFSAVHAFPWQAFGFCQPVAVTQAREALRLLRTQVFDAAVVDMRMPELSGTDLIRICGEEGVPTVFIVLSGYADFQYVQAALRLQAFDYCLKPVLSDAAEAALERLAERIRAQRCRSDPETAAALNDAADLERLFLQRELPFPDGALSMALVGCPQPERLPAMMCGRFASSLVLWASEEAVLIFSPQPENALVQDLRALKETASCYTQPVAREALAPSRQYQLLMETLPTLEPGGEPAALRFNDCSPAFLELLDYVDRHLIDDLSLHDLSNRFHLNYTYCSELFRSVTGLTFTKYLTRHRMERAAGLIAHSSVSMTEIARQTGYGNYNHFSATFKSYFGHTPAAYRSLHRKKGDS